MYSLHSERDSISSSSGGKVVHSCVITRSRLDWLIFIDPPT
jgi:hypothetical protein